MATKDWEERKSNVPSHIHESFNEEKNGLLWVQNVRDKAYYVNVSYFNKGYGKNFVNKRFTTKAQAMTYAKSYMRTH